MTGLEQAARGKRVLVTGGSRGIGKMIVRVLAANGYDVQFVFHKSEQPAQALLEQLKAEWPDQEFSACRVDLGDPDEVEGFSDQISKEDDLYALVHSAGQSYDSLAALVEQDRAEMAMQVNFFSLTRLVATAIRPMMRARSGRIVSIGSVTAQHGVSGNSIYAATKGATLSYMRSLAVELAPRGVTVNSIAPGFVDTDLLSPYAEQREAIEQQIPIHRYAEPVEVAELVRYLLSPEAGYITGSVIPIDGGLMASIAIRR